MMFAHFLINVNESNSFIVGCEETREALLVDMADLDPRIPAFLDRHGLRPTTLFITHDHFDHTGAVEEAMRRYDVRVYSGSGRAGGCRVLRAKQGDIVRFGAIEGRVVETPGHTPDSISLILPGMAFTGDALFSGSVGGTSSARDAERQLDSIRTHLFALPDDTEVHPGHGPSSTIGIERRFNPFFNPSGD